MKKHNITQIALSEKSGIPLDTIKQILRGKTKNPRLDTINAMLNALDMEMVLYPCDKNHLTAQNSNIILAYDINDTEYKFQLTEENFNVIIKLLETISD